MVASKRPAADPMRSSNENKITCSGEGGTTKSLVSGGTKFFSCTGFFINFDDECQTILTSTTLLRDPDGSNKIVEGLKVGIGGPLVDINGKFLGMNYYDKKVGTPFLYFDVLRGILQYFKTKRSMDGKVCHIREDNYYKQNRWILPDPSSMDEHECEEEHRVLASLHPTSSRRI